MGPEWSLGGAITAESACLQVERRDDVRWLWLNRPERRNALDPDLVLALDEAAQEAAHDAKTSVVVLAGRGPSFCAGADLRHLHALATSGGDPLPFLRALSATFSRIERMPKPVLAAVHGHVVAGGLELALACDVVVARSGTLMGDGHLRNGLLPAGGASVRLPRKVGEPMARWLMLTGELLPAESFLASGLVRAVATEPDFPTVLGATVDLLRSRSGPSQGRVKQLLNARPPADDEALALELATFRTHWQATDTAGSLEQFLSGRR